MSNKYLVWIDEQIAQHEREIAKLTIAKEVIMHVETAYKKLEPLKKVARPLRNKRGAAFDRVVGILGNGNALTKSEITKAVLIKDPSTNKKAITNALYNGKKTKRLIYHEEQKKYSLPKESIPEILFTAKAA